MLLVDGSSETGLFRHLSNHVFGVRNFGNTKSMTVIFSQKVQDLIYIWKMDEEIEETFFVSEISASELVALNCPN